MAKTPRKPKARRPVPKRAPKRPARPLDASGLWWIALGLVWNPWSLRALFANLESVPPLLFTLVGVLGAILVGFGIAKLFGFAPGVSQLRPLPTPVLIALTVVGLYPGAVWLGVAPAPGTSFEMKIERMLASEELLLDGTPELKRLAKSAMNLDLPDHKSRGMFDDEVEIIDLAPGSHGGETHSVAGTEIASRSWPVAADAASGDPEELGIWSALLNEVAYFDHAKFYFIDVEELAPKQKSWGTDMGFAGLARLEDGRWSALKGKLHVHLEARRGRAGDRLVADHPLGDEVAQSPRGRPHSF